MNESYLVNKWMSHVSWMNESCPMYESLISDILWMNESWHIFKAWVTSHISNGGRRLWNLCRWEINESCLMYVCMSHVSYTYEWVMSHISSGGSRVWHVCRWERNESCLMYVWVSHVSYMYGWVMSHISNGGRRVWHVCSWDINESCLMYVWVSHASRMNESCHTFDNTYDRVMSHAWRGHEPCAAILVYEWLMSHV